jgi:hypothetical protein
MNKDYINLRASDASYHGHHDGADTRWQLVACTVSPILCTFSNHLVATSPILSSKPIQFLGPIRCSSTLGIHALVLYT